MNKIALIILSPIWIAASLPPEAPTISALMQAAHTGNRTAVATFLESYKDADIKDQNGSTMLQWAASGDQDQVCETLILNGAKIDYQLPWGMTALMYSALSGGTKAMAVLLRAKANTEIADCHGYTALMHAASGPKELSPQARARGGRQINIDGFKLLLKNGAVPSLESKRGGHMCVDEGEIYTLLDAAGQHTKLIRK